MINYIINVFSLFYKSPTFQLCPMIIYHGSNSTLRHQHTISIVRRDIAVARGGFVYRGAALFNSLPLDLLQETSLLAFKRRVKKWVSESILVKPPQPGAMQCNTEKYFLFSQSKLTIDLVFDFPSFPYFKNSCNN